MIKKLLTYSVVMLLLAVEVYTQSPTGEFTEVVTLPGKDTLVLHRKHGQWWFGATAGGNFNLFFDDLKIPVFPNLDTLQEILSEYPIGYGTGYYVGVMGEWLPPGEKWAVSLKGMFWDIRSSNSETAPFEDPTADPLVDTSLILYRHEEEMNYRYISISPSVRYNLPISGLYLLGGADIDLLMGYEARQRVKFDNTGDIDQDEKINVEGEPIRFGAHFGVGYDIFAADVNHHMRVYFSPYITIHAGSQVFTGFGSSRNMTFARVGMNLKFGPDKITRDTLKYNPTFMPPPVMIAAVQYDRGINFPGFEPYDIPVQALAYVAPKDQVLTSASSVEIDSLRAIDTTLLASRDNTAQPVSAEADVTANTTAEVQVPKETKPKIDVTPNATKTFTFRSATSTSLTNDIEDYLDAVADYMKSNTGARVLIVGHSDNSGTDIENQKRSEDRATKVVQYLMGKGINRRRLFDSGRGALEPVADNSTARGRRANRRVEVIVQGR